MAPHKYTVYTDGGCDPNPGPGGWGVVILENGKDPLELWGSAPQATNNRMEMTAAIEALKTIEPGSEVDLYTDSTYLKNGVTQWLKQWRARGWLTKDKEPVKNQDLWQALDSELTGHRVAWHWTRGHSGDRWNERADALATQGIRRVPAAVLEKGSLLIYTAVSFSGKDQSGAIAILARFAGDEGSVEKRVEKRFDGESANRLHLLSAILALEMLKRPMAPHVWTASDYVRDGVTRWIEGWRERGWKTKEGSEVSHRDLWEKLAKLCAFHSVKWHVAKKEGEAPVEMAQVKARAHEIRTGAPEAPAADSGP